MKKIILAALVMLAFSFQAQAQRMSNNALGLRFGGGSGTSGFEVSYQRKLTKANRLELDLGWSDNNHDDYDSFKLTGLYQWVWKIEDGFNWYAGVGAGVGSNSYGHYYHKDHYHEGESEMFATLDGDLGIEYNFDIPLQIALDWRPEIHFVDNHDEGLHNSVALALRFRF